MWRHYYSGTQALIFVVNAADRDKIVEARQLLHTIISHPDMQEVVILVFANKQDLSDGMLLHFHSMVNCLLPVGAVMESAVQA